MTEIKQKLSYLDHVLNSAIVAEIRNCIILKEEAVRHNNVLLNGLRLTSKKFQIEQTYGQWMLFIAS
jgi:hypothetical protein